MPKERVGEQVFVFLSDAYAQVTATVILTDRGSIVVDSLLFPSEAQEVRSFAMRGGKRVSYLINTHGHLDHVACNYLYPESDVIAHTGVRQAMEGELRSALAEAARSIGELREVRLRPPTITAAAEVVVRHGGLTLRLIPLPGHSQDAFGVYVEEERILVAGDAMLPVPHFVGGDPEILMRSLQRIRSLTLNTIIQGHGDVILKGEVRDAIEYRMRYVRQVRKYVHDAIADGASLQEVLQTDIEDFGGSRLDLDGLTQQLHEDNVTYLFRLQTEGVRAAPRI
ncbi:MAG: MBL fold metallo-hydrolase [Anaerolineae bacterium]|nr:MBL fold metallo-hydrolase [Anaerolineae bacterium]